MTRVAYSSQKANIMNVKISSANVVKFDTILSSLCNSSEIVRIVLTILNILRLHKMQLRLIVRSVMIALRTLLFMREAGQPDHLSHIF